MGDLRHLKSFDAGSNDGVFYLCGDTLPIVGVVAIGFI